MAKYKCSICGYIYDEKKEGIKFEDLPEDFKCPMCSAPKSLFKKIEETEEENIKKTENIKEKDDYLAQYLREFDEEEVHMSDIHEMAQTGKTIINAMGTQVNKISWNDILIMGSMLNPMPLLEDEEVSLTTIIGKKSKRPLIIESPIYVSHMSFGALSREAKISLSKGSNSVKTAMCSGEGGILESEYDNAYKYIFEYVPNKYSVNLENMKKVDAIEIKIGQGTKPGMGGHLPGDKVTEEIAKVRGKEKGSDIISPSKFEEIKTKQDLKNLVNELREKSEGAPIGIKIAAGHIEKDLEFASFAGPDFITIDGRGGATGASPKVVKDNTSVPTIYALYRARKYLDEHNLDIDLVITGGLRTSGDFVKALAMGADAVAIATSAMIALGCSQYRICHSGKCPLGIATQDEKLRSRLKIEKSSERVANYFKAINQELKTFARITSHKDIHDLNLNDIRTTSRDISENTNIKHV